MFDDQDEEQVLSRMFAAFFALALVMTPVAVFAEDEAELSFSELDANGDGQVSEIEAQAEPELAAVFSEADGDGGNGDGVLDRPEFQKALELIEQG